MLLSASLSLAAVGIVRSFAWFVCAYYLWRNRNHTGVIGAALGGIASIFFAVINANLWFAPHWVLDLTIYASVLVPTFLAITALGRDDLRRK